MGVIMGLSTASEPQTDGLVSLNAKTLFFARSDLPSYERARRAPTRARRRAHSPG